MRILHRISGQGHFPQMATVGTLATSWCECGPEILHEVVAPSYHQRVLQFLGECEADSAEMALKTGEHELLTRKWKTKIGSNSSSGMPRSGRSNGPQIAWWELTLLLHSSANIAPKLVV